VAAADVAALLDTNPDLHPSDVVILADHDVGLRTISLLEQAGHDVLHVSEPGLDDDSRRRKQRLKRRFWARSPGIKGCAFHSFKGWEARAVVLIASPRRGFEQVLYVGLTRVKGDAEQGSAHVHVINTIPDLEGFKDRFEREITVDEVAALGGQQALEL